MTDAMRSRSGLAILMALTVLGPFSVGMIVAVQPEIAATFQVRAQDMQYALSIPFLALAVSQLAIGALYDRFGARRVLVAFGALFVAGGVLGTLAASFDLFLLARGMQAIGGACGFIVARALLFDTYENKTATAYLGYLTSAMVIGPMFAPVIGSAIATAATWRVLFAMTALLGGVILALVIRRFRDAGTTTTADATSRMARTWQVITHAEFLLACGIAACASGTFFVFLTAGPFVAEAAYGIGAREFGVCYVLTSAAFALGSLTCGRLVKHLTTAALARLGVTATFVALAGLIALSSTDTAFAFFAPIALMSFGNGLTVPAISSFGLTRVASHHGVASGFLAFAQLSVGALLTYVAGHLSVQSTVPMAMLMAASATICLGGLVLLPRSRGDLASAIAQSQD